MVNFGTLYIAFILIIVNQTSSYSFNKRYFRYPQILKLKALNNNVPIEVTNEGDTNRLNTDQPNKKFFTCIKCRTGYEFNKECIHKALRCMICDAVWVHGNKLYTNDTAHIISVSQDIVNKSKESLQALSRVMYPSRFSVYVTNIPFKVTESDIAQWFAEYGVTRINLAKEKSGRSRGFAFVEVATEEDRAMLMKEMNNFFVTPTHKLRIEYEDGRSQTVLKSSNVTTKSVIEGDLSAHRETVNTLILPSSEPVAELQSEPKVESRLEEAITSLQVEVEENEELAPQVEENEELAPQPSSECDDMISLVGTAPDKSSAIESDTLVYDSKPSQRSVDELDASNSSVVEDLTEETPIAYHNVTLTISNPSHTITSNDTTDTVDASKAETNLTSNANTAPTSLSLFTKVKTFVSNAIWRGKR